MTELIGTVRPDTKQLKGLGLVVRKECWTLSWRGKLAVILAFIGLGAGLTYSAYPFLALNQPVGGDFMVLEGWTIPHRVATEVAAEFKHGHYRKLLVLEDSYDGEYSDPTDRLVQHGIPRDVIENVIYPGVQRDRTYHAAIIASDWFHRNDPSVPCFDVVTVGPHARRSLMMFRKVFEKNAKIGVIALDDTFYDPKHWWHTSEGVRELQGEVIAYVYAQVYYR